MKFALRDELLRLFFVPYNLYPGDLSVIVYLIHLCLKYLVVMFIDIGIMRMITISFCTYHAKYGIKVDAPSRKLISGPQVTGNFFFLDESENESVFKVIQLYINGSMDTQSNLQYLCILLATKIAHYFFVIIRVLV